MIRNDIQLFSLYLSIIPISLNNIKQLSYTYPMAQKPSRPAQDLTSAFIPSSLLRKSTHKFTATLANKYQFQKTTGNDYIHIDPPEIKFNGYQLQKSYAATVKIINRAPIPQRIAIIAPQVSSFSIKTNKKGSIASGMSEVITVLFKSQEYKYIWVEEGTSMTSIKTQTQNFVVPLYAYPSLPDLRAIFPKLIDFGQVPVTETSKNYYPIKNDVPLSFQFEFVYQKQCQEIIINPLRGVIPANQTFVVQISLCPSAKATYLAQAVLYIKQFDFQPLAISIMGNGQQKANLAGTKRIKSSKLAPLKDGQQVKKTPSSVLRRGNSRQSQKTVSNLGATLNAQVPQIGMASMKRTHIRTSYPKLFNSKKPVQGLDDDNKTLNPAQIVQRQYLNRFNRITDLDKQKQIKFACYPGDRPMTQQQIQQQNQISRQFAKARDQALLNGCLNRHNPQLSQSGTVQFKNIVPRQTTWDDKRNDQHHNRRQLLSRFMNAGTKVILKYRMLKRLSKIQQFLRDCADKMAVRRKVEESHAKAIDQQSGFSLKDQIQFTFQASSIRPSYFQLMFQQNKDNQKSTLFKPQGKTSFDDLKQIKQCLPHRLDQFQLAQLNFPPDYYNQPRNIPKPRQSGQQEWFYKSSCLPSYQAQPLSSLYALPIKATAHHFIYNDDSLRRYQNYGGVNQKDAEYLFDNNEPIEDQFQGWTGGQPEILKAKFTRNVGFNFQTFSSYGFSSQKYPLPALATLGQDLPLQIPHPQYQDTIQQGDSDQQALQATTGQDALKFVIQLQEKNPELKERRASKVIKNHEAPKRAAIQNNLQIQKNKVLGQFVGKVRQVNRWAQSSENGFII